MTTDNEKIAWVFGYMKANFDIFAEHGAATDKLSDSMQIITMEVLKLLGITNRGIINKVIIDLDGLDLELAVRKVLEDGKSKSNGKTFSAVF
jgi:hypothetical protein